MRRQCRPRIDDPRNLRIWVTILCTLHIAHSTQSPSGALDLGEGNEDAGLLVGLREGDLAGDEVYLHIAVGLIMQYNIQYTYIQQNRPANRPGPPLVVHLSDSFLSSMNGHLLADGRGGGRLEGRAGHQGRGLLLLPPQPAALLLLAEGRLADLARLEGGGGRRPGGDHPEVVLPGGTRQLPVGGGEVS